MSEAHAVQVPPKPCTVAQPEGFLPCGSDAMVLARVHPEPGRFYDVQACRFCLVDLLGLRDGRESTTPVLPDCWVELFPMRAALERRAA